MTELKRGGGNIPCANPLYRVLLPKSVTGTEEQWRTVTANQYLKYKAVALESFNVPCGNCQACRIAIAKEWTGRIMMECTEWEHNWFVTLTYDDEHVPIRKGVSNNTGEVVEEFTVLTKDLQKFMKDLRRYYKHHYDEDNIRYYGVSEYGDLNNRPHYHVCLFNCNIRDLKEYPQKNALNQQYYISNIIEKIWGKGQVRIGELTSQSAGYTARYIMKKYKGKAGAEEWAEKHVKDREFSMMSRQPGIGSNYFEEHKEKMLTDGFILVPALEGAFRATTPKSFTYRCRNPGLTAKDGTMRVSEEEDRHNRALGAALRKKNERFSEAATNTKMKNSSLDFESIIAVENEILENKILALRQKGMKE